MKNIVRSFLPTESSKELFENGKIVLDTNVLLNLYSLKKENALEILSQMETIQNKLWLPYHTVLEFMKIKNQIISKELSELDERNRIISKQLKIQNLDNLIKEIKETLNKNFCKKYIGDEKFNKIQTLVEELSIVTEPLKEKLKNISDEKNKIYEEIKREKNGTNENDEILNKLLEIYDGRIGEKYIHDKLVDISRECIEKTYYTLLPGHSKKDLSKGTNTYGDYINYYSIREYSEKESKDIIYVTNDKKDDWGKLIIKGTSYDGKNEFSYNTTIYEDFAFHTNHQILIMDYKKLGDELINHNITETELSQNTKDDINYLYSKINSNDSYEERLMEILSNYFHDFKCEKLDEKIFELEPYNTKIKELKKELKKITEKLADIYSSLDENAHNFNKEEQIKLIQRLEDPTCEKHGEYEILRKKISRINEEIKNHKEEKEIILNNYIGYGLELDAFDSSNLSEISEILDEYSDEEMRKGIINDLEYEVGKNGYNKNFKDLIDFFAK